MNVWYLTPFEILTIIIVRNIRLELGISGEELSLHLDKSKKYVAVIESTASYSKYTDEVLLKIAIYFTEIAKKIERENGKENIPVNFKTEYSILDLQPSEILDRDKVIKEIPPIPAGTGSAATLSAVIETTDFFDIARTLPEIVDYCNNIQNQNWKGSDFTSALSRATKGENKRLEVKLVNGINTYVAYKPKAKS
ncbi:hypothetical protein [Sphingobacterium sp. HMA12]|uniref:hypothetical protein n=1 Tax=Sphingobacterium sp. HMA12 TaxID=2050894 RepID=UPI000CE9D401|nr:hypothetical protein [Sphingobacterium sp. HMA12]